MIERPLSGDVMVFDLTAERDRTDDPSIVGRSGRNARTLLAGRGGIPAALTGGVPHSVAYEEGGEFLLTVVKPEPRPD